MPFSSPPPNIRYWTKPECIDCENSTIMEIEIPLTDGDRLMYFKYCDKHFDEMINVVSKDAPEIKEAINAARNEMKKEIN